MQQYEYKFIYKRGAENPTDILSRMPLPTRKSKPNVADEFVNFVAHHAVPKAMTLEEVAQSTLKDNVLQAVTQSIQTDKWNDDPLVASFYNVRNELTGHHARRCSTWSPYCHATSIERSHSCHRASRSSRGCKNQTVVADKSLVAQD